MTGHLPQFLTTTDRWLVSIVTFTPFQCQALKSEGGNAEKQINIIFCALFM